MNAEQIKSLLDSGRATSSEIRLAKAALAAMAERDALRQQLNAKLSDHMNGHPCAEIRWQHERDTLQARVKALEAGLALIDAMDPESMIAGCSADAARGLVSRMGEIARAILSKGSPDA
jgi:hypothetical protein